MAHIFMIGATGGIGSRLVPMLADKGHRITALHRKPEQAETLRKAGAEPVQGDLMEMGVDDFAAAAKGADYAVFSAGAAGSGKERTTAIDGEAPIKLIEAARQTGLKRIYMVSAIPDAGRDRERNEGFEHYMSTKKKADVALVESGIDYVIVRPGTLQDDDGDGRVTAGRVVAYGDVARGNVAAMLAELIDTPEVTCEIIEVVNGETLVETAVNGLKRS